MTPQDAEDYAAFLDVLAAGLHGVGAELTVDIARWGAIWNYTALAGTGVDRFADMGTYTDDPVAWDADLAYATAHLPLHKLVIGLETTKASTGGPYSPAELTRRFAALAAAGVHAVGLWKAPIPEAFWGPLAGL